jgi:hypothetical protein
MNHRRLMAILGFLLLPFPLLAQEAQSMGLGGAGTAAPMEVFGLYWNPALLSLPYNTKPPTPWTIASGASFYDTSNSGKAILRFNPDEAMASSQDPIHRLQQLSGIFAVKYEKVAGGVIYNQDLDSIESQGAYSFFHDREAGTIPLLGSYALNFQETKRQIADLVLGYSTPFPLGTFPFFSIGGSLKYHVGLNYEQSSLTGTYTQGSPTGYQYVKYSSTSGWGLSMDAGFFVRINDTMQFAMMFQNIQSTFTWQAQRRTYTLDSTTGQETVSGPPTSQDLSQPFPYATKLGMVAAPQDKDMVLSGEVSWSQGQTRWKAGLAKYYPANSIVVRMGTFADQVSNEQMWTFGAGYLKPNFNLDISFVTRSLPAVQDSLAFGLAIDAAIRF